MPQKDSVPFTLEEIKDIQQQLDKPLEPECIQFRPAPQGSVGYVEGWKALSLANEIFGFNGWSSEILSLNTDFVDVDNGRISLGISCMVRVHLRDGYGSAENQRSKVSAYEKARKEAVTDAMKRALRMFGYRLGNCAYDKNFLKQVRSGGSKMGGGGGGGGGTKSINNIRPTDNNQPPNVKLSKVPPPLDFAPKWKHPKTMTPEVESGEVIVTEEQLLDFGSFFADNSFDPTLQENFVGTSNNRRGDLDPKLGPKRSPMTNRAEHRTVSMPTTQFRPPLPNDQ